MTLSVRNTSSTILPLSTSPRSNSLTSHFLIQRDFDRLSYASLRYNRIVLHATSFESSMDRSRWSFKLFLIAMLALLLSFSVAAMVTGGSMYSSLPLKVEESKVWSRTKFGRTGNGGLDLSMRGNATDDVFSYPYDGGGGDDPRGEFGSASSSEKNISGTLKDPIKKNQTLDDDPSHDSVGDEKDGEVIPIDSVADEILGGSSYTKSVLDSAVFNSGGDEKDGDVIPNDSVADEMLRGSNYSESPLDSAEFGANVPTSAIPTIANSSSTLSTVGSPNATSTTLNTSDQQSK